MSRTMPRVVVRAVRNGLELRVDGTLASFRSSSGAPTGTVWWTLAAPVVLLPPRPRVLLLGLGAGSAAAAVRVLSPEAQIVGVERDREVLRAARRHFDLDRHGVEIVEDDAFAYLRRERRRFDLVVEDLFVGTVRKVRKPDPLLAADGYALLERRVARRGLLVCNTIHETTTVVRALQRLKRRVVSLDVRGFWNRIVLGGRDVPNARALRKHLATHPALAAVLPRVSVRGWPG